VMDGHNVDNEDTRTIRLGGIGIGWRGKHRFRVANCMKP
jgi:hypothetical protein